MATIDKQLTLRSRKPNSFANFKKLGKAKMKPGTCVSRVEMIKQLWARFDANHTLLYDDEEKDPTENYFTTGVYDQVEESYLINLGMFRDHSDGLRVASIAGLSTEQSNLGVPSVHQVKFPAIELPTFSGDIQDWVMFRDTFSEMIGRNDSLPSVYKMHYLRSALKGEALELLQEIPVAADSFDTAWKAVKDHFNNTRLLTTKLLSKLMSLRPMSTESAHEVSRIITGTKNLL